MELYTEIKLKDKTLEIHYDIHPESPREWCNLGTIAAFHHRYALGEIQKYSDLLWELNSDDWSEKKYETLVHGECMTTLLKEMDKQGFIYLPIYMYEHSGITISTSPFGCQWDSGQLGIIFVSREKIKEEYGWERITAKRREKIEKYLKSEVETYDQYLRGDVYGFVYKEDDDVVDSCWGFYDLQDMEQYMPEDAQEVFKELMRQEGKEI